MSASPVNPPGMPALAYRARTYATSLPSMVANLPVLAIPSGPNAGTTPLAALRTRQPGDPTLALLDAWAMVMDVLCFYQERIANEGFLGTAVERVSALDLARGSGCELGPGLAASVYLVFDIDSSPGAPGQAAVPVGTRVQSVPGQGQQPQTVETVQAISARAAWNQLRPLVTSPQILAGPGNQGGPGVSQLQLIGTATGLAVGSVLAVPGQGAVVHVTGLTANPASGTTTVQLRETVNLCAPPALPAGSATLAPGPLPLTPASVGTYVLGYTWEGAALDAFLLDKDWDPDAVTGLAGDLQAQAAAPQATNVVQAFQQQVGFFGRTAPAGYYQVTAVSTSGVETAVTGLTVAPGAGTVALSWTAAAPAPASYNVYRAYGPGAPVGKSGGVLVGTSTSTTFTDAFAGWSNVNGQNVRNVWTGSGGASYTAQSPSAHVVLERSVPGLQPNSYIVLSDPADGMTDTACVIGGAVAAAVSGYGTSLTTTCLTLEAPNTALSFLTRNSTAYVQSAPLQLASAPSQSSPTLSQGSQALTLGGLCLGLAPGQLVMLTGPRADAPSLTASEVLTLSDIVHQGGYTQLTFATPLQYGYLAASATLSANVAPATHGQTNAAEIIGSGDGTLANQTFTLARTGLTFVATPTGPASTLSVQVNGVAWQEVPSLYGRGPHDQVYMVRLDDAGDVNVTFGDGVYGARLPTGQENVAATYRTGTGVAGDVGAGAVTLLMNRPLGVRGVSNPLAAAGGVDPDTLAQAKANAPASMRTLGRIVSLSDYQDFASTFPGIAKAQAATLAQAVAVSNGVATFIHLTVAGAGGAALDSTSALWQGLVGAIASAGDPRLTVLVDTYRPCPFGVTATLYAAPGQTPSVVKAAALAALASAFSFDQRAFAQQVFAAEVIAQLQRVPGVYGVTLTGLFRNDATSPPASPPPQSLPANVGGWNPAAPGQTLGPELLLLSAMSTTLTVEVLP